MRKILITALFAAVLLTSCTQADLTQRGGASTVAPNAQEVDVTLSEYKITSSVTAFEESESYHFIITNAGKQAHEFIVQLEPDSASRDASIQTLGDIESVAPGSTKTMDLSLPSTFTGNQLEFSSHLGSDYQSGMREVVNVFQGD